MYRKKSNSLLTLLLVVLLSGVIPAALALAAELVSVEVVAGTDNAVIVVEQGQTVNFTIKLSATGLLRNEITSSNPSRARIHTAYWVIGTTGSSGTFSGWHNFWSKGVAADKDDARWSGHPTPYSISATAYAAPGATPGDYIIRISSETTNPTITPAPPPGHTLRDETADYLTIRVVAAPPSNNPPTIIVNDVTKEGDTTGGWTLVFSDIGSASDEEDGMPSVSCTPAIGSVLPLGTNLVACTATDSGGLTASDSGTVTVVDTTPPSLVDLPQDMTVEGNTTGGADVDYTAPTATDIVDPAPVVSCIPASGLFFALGGPWSVTCTATDASGNSASESFDITVEDTIAPTLLNMPDDMTVEGNTTGGADVDYTAPTATDIVDASPTVGCSPASGSFFALGETSVTCTSADASGNSSSESFNVTVIDTTPPAITCPADFHGTVGQTVSLGWPDVSDIVDPAPAVTNNAPASFPPGTTTVTWTATDASENSNDCTQKVTLTYIFLGFFPPIDNGSVLNTVKNGSTVPVKWRLLDANGNYITDVGTVWSGYPKIFAFTCLAGQPEDAVEITATGGTSLRYDFTSLQFVYNWQTPKLPNTCWRLDVKFIDGETKSALFKLK